MNRCMYMMFASLLILKLELEQHLCLGGNMNFAQLSPFLRGDLILLAHCISRKCTKALRLASLSLTYQIPERNHHYQHSKVGIFRKDEMSFSNQKPVNSVPTKEIFVNMRFAIFIPTGNLLLTFQYTFLLVNP